MPGLVDQYVSHEAVLSTPFPVIVPELRGLMRIGRPHPPATSPGLQVRRPPAPPASSVRSVTDDTFFALHDGESARAGRPTAQI
jgi:hypothetical protein